MAANVARPAGRVSSAMRRPRRDVGPSRELLKTGSEAACDQAQKHLTTATTMYRGMDMRFWLEQAEAGRDT